MAATGFEEVMAEAHSALDSIVKGDPNGYKALFSKAEDITLGNPFGGFARGKDAVYEQLERAASYYRDGEMVSVETVIHSVGADLAYTVEVERVRSKVGGRDESSDVAVRVTCVYRLEPEGWKLVHRHADPVTSKQAVETVIQRA